MPETIRARGAEARQVYRVAFDPEDAPAVRVEAAGASLSGRVADLSSMGMGAVFSGDLATVLALGSGAQLVITGSGLRQPINLEARVRFRLQRDASWRYGFSFEDEGALRAQLGGDLFRIFNRRASYRVHPNPTSPIEVELAVPGDAASRVVGSLEDISANGLGVGLELGREQPGFARGEVEVRFSLPPAGQPLRLRARVRRAQLEDEVLVYGLEFDAEASESFERQQEVVLDYVMERQRELLRVKSEGR